MPTSDTSQSRDAELRSYVDILRRRWRTIAATVVVLVLLSLATTLQQEPQYLASADLLVEQSRSEIIFEGDASTAFAAVQNADRRLNNEVRALNSGSTKDAVDEIYEGALDPDEVSASVSAALSDAITVELTAPDAEEAARLVNLYVETYIELRRQQKIDELTTASGQLQEQIEDLTSRIDQLRVPLTEVEQRLAADPGNDELEARRDDLQAQLSPDLTPLETQRAFYQQALEDLRLSSGITAAGGARVLTRADPPDSPVAPKPVRTAVLLGIVGLFLGVGLAFVRDALDERIRNISDLSRAAPQVPPLALIPENQKDDGVHELALRDDPGGRVAEGYRSLRTSVRFASLDRSMQVIQITSAVTGEGKSTTAANLALAFAHEGSRVVVVDCDLRRPTIHARLNVPRGPGFTELLLGDTELSTAIRSIDDYLYVLPAGLTPPNPSELLSSARTTALFRALADEFDIVVVDSPPLLAVTDALVVSRLVDVTVLVVNTRSTQRRVVTEAVQALEQVQAPLLGLVANQVAHTGRYGYGYGYGYDEGFDSTPPRRGRLQRRKTRKRESASGR